MKRKVWLLNLILVMLICILLACSHIHKLRQPEINPDILTPEIEIPAGGEKIEEQTVDTGEDTSTESDADDKADQGSQDNDTGDNSGDIVTPEF